MRLSLALAALPFLGYGFQSPGTHVAVLPDEPAAGVLPAEATSGPSRPDGALTSPYDGTLPSRPVVGAIQGQVDVFIPPPRRSTDRYARGRASTPEVVQSVPSVAYIRGPVPGAGAGSVPTSVTVAQQDTTFQPAAVVVPVGGTVEFPNEDPFFHNVFSYSSGGRFDLGRYPEGESKSVTFEEAGIIRVYCEVHETMRSAVIVSENPFYAVVGEDGTFTIEGVPAGSWELEVWHPDLDPQVVEVEVPDGGVAEVAVELR